jgi:hypothetical protein
MRRLALYRRVGRRLSRNSSPLCWIQKDRFSSYCVLDAAGEIVLDCRQSTKMVGVRWSEERLSNPCRPAAQLTG